MDADGTLLTAVKKPINMHGVYTFRLPFVTKDRCYMSPKIASVNTHGGRVTHICVSKVGSDNWFRYSGNIWTDAGLLLTHWGRDEIDAILQTTVSRAFSWMKIYRFRIKFHWSLFPRVQWPIIQHWFRKWLGADPGDKPLSEPMMIILLTHIYMRHSASMS